jgi:Fe-S-cluster containining protein
VIRQIVPNDVCLKCRGCCRFSQPETSWSPILLDEEIEQLMARNYPPSIIAPSKRIRPVPAPGSDRFLCAFLNEENNTCKVYSFRPLDCSLYPFMLNRKGRSVFLACDLRCPFVEENLEKEEFKEHSRYLSELLNTPAYLRLLRDNPQIIQEYEGLMDLSEIRI